MRLVLSGTEGRLAAALLRPGLPGAAHAPPLGKGRTPSEHASVECRLVIALRFPQVCVVIRIYSRPGPRYPLPVFI